MLKHILSKFYSSPPPPPPSLPPPQSPLPVVSNSLSIVAFSDICRKMEHYWNITIYRIGGSMEGSPGRSVKTPEFGSVVTLVRCPPPQLFISQLSLSLPPPLPISFSASTIALMCPNLQIILYIYYVVDMNASISVTGPVPLHSPLIWDPYRRYQAWRYLSYMLVHIGLFHVLFNCLAQLVIGLPLELVHKWWRIGIVYLGGVIAGRCIFLWISIHTCVRRVSMGD